MSTLLRAGLVGEHTLQALLLKKVDYLLVGLHVPDACVHHTVHCSCARECDCACACACACARECVCACACACARARVCLCVCLSVCVRTRACCAHVCVVAVYMTCVCMRVHKAMRERCRPTGEGLPHAKIGYVRYLKEQGFSYGVLIGTTEESVAGSQP